jgi:hypothetical protein
MRPNAATAVEATRLNAGIRETPPVQQNFHARPRPRAVSSTAAVLDHACARVQARRIERIRLATLSLGMNRDDSRDLRENKRREYQGSQQRFHVLSSEVDSGSRLLPVNASQ